MHALLYSSTCRAQTGEGVHFIDTSTPVSTWLWFTVVNVGLTQVPGEACRQKTSDMPSITKKETIALLLYIQLTKFQI